MRRVVLETPYSGDIVPNVNYAVNYARRCLLDCLNRGEAPIASHLLFPQILDENDPKQRELGITAGRSWISNADALVVYTDRGVSSGMSAAISHAELFGTPVEYRQIDEAQQ